MAKDKYNDITKAWQYYELGREYNNRLVPNQYRTVDTNWEFFSGNQWIHIPETPAMSRLSRPVFNIIKRVTSLFVAQTTASATTVSFEPLSYYDGTNMDDPETNASVYATEEVRNLYEKFKMDYRTREALFDGAVTGDYCAHFYWNPDARPYGGAFADTKGEIEMELVDGINVMFGNPNTTDVESQPYILIIGRDTVENLKWEANQYRKNKKGLGKSGTASDKDTVESITGDAEWQWQTGVGGETEIVGDDDKTNKALYVYLYTKVTREEDVIDEATGLPKTEIVLDENGDPVPEKDKKGKPVLDFQGNPVYKTKPLKKLVTSVHVTKATRNVNIFEDVDTGLTHYPIAWGNWEKQKNQYHGRALVTGIVPNQIFINSMFAMIFRHLQLQSFPKTIYNAELISQWNNEVGVALGVRGLQPGQDLRSVATVLQPSDMSNQIVMCIDKCMGYTKECLGATDAQMGNLALENTSALMVLQSSSEAPLENPRQGMLEWHEDIAKILLDMMGTYYGQRPIVREREFREPITGPDGAPMIDPMTGQMQEKTVVHRVIEDFDFSQFKNLWFNIKVNAGATTQYSEIAMVQTLDNLRREGTLEIIDYLERIPDKLIPRKQELIDTIKQRTGAMGSEAMMQMQNQAAGSQPSKDPSKATRGGTGLMAMGGPLDSAKRISQMPNSIQERYQSLPNKAQNALLRASGGK
ncbi:MAG: hypothetical protein IIY48_05340 [Clostridia bacterium]|nr:hypothetical protein [Clostridia bacterium]